MSREPCEILVTFPPGKTVLTVTVNTVMTQAQAEEFAELARYVADTIIARHTPSPQETQQ